MTSSPVSAGNALLANIWDGLNTAGAPLTGAGGSFGSILLELAMEIRPLLLILAVIMIGFAGLRMVVGQEDEAGNKVKSTIIISLAGLFLGFSVDVFLQAFYYQGVIAPDAGANTVGTYVMGIINWVLGLAVPLALLGIIIGAVLALVKPTSDEGVSKLRQAVVASVAGIAVLALREVFVASFGSGFTGATPGPLKAALASIVNYVLAFTAVLAAGAIIYAGLLLLVSWGKDDAKEKAKGIILRVIIGLAVILLSAVVIQTIVGVFGW
ncbi:MAG: hypothetical protein PHW10_05325 [Candidatus Peribacteraceae bacterium]|nr:hypothetical protein [Candidatus Peribacteraceae bacterium]